jgi:LacI family transcriptional regulator
MVTLADVARHAQVAQSTVSYVLSGKRPISEVTRRRVEDAIRELGYHPHAGARALASRRSSVLALVIPLRPELHLPVQMVLAVVTTARAFAHDVLLITGDEGPDGLRRVARSALVDGFVLMDVELHDDRIPVLQELELPGVLIGVPQDTTGLTCVDLDFEAAAALAVDHLHGLGHREIVLIGQPIEVYERGSGFANRSVFGFTRRARELGVAEVHVPCDGSRERIGAIVAGHADATAFVVHNETALRGVLEALRAAGRAVPEDVSVLSLAPDAFDDMLSPLVTSIVLPSEQMGRSAVELLMAKLDGRDSGTTLLPPHLTAGDSTAPAA